MAYETGTASSPNDLLDKMRIFALANGFTVDYWGVRTNVGGGSQGNGLNALALNKGGLYWVLYHDTTAISVSDPTPRIRGYTYPGPWVSTNGTDAQTNKTNDIVSNNLTAFLAYHFFTDSAQNYLHAVFEVVAGRFSHLGIGRMNKSGGGSVVPYAHGLWWNFTTTGGQINWASGFHGIPFDAYVPSAARAGTVFRADSDGVTPRNYAMRFTNSSNFDGLGGFTITAGSFNAMEFGGLLGQIAPSALTGRAPLIPLIVLATRTVSPQVVSIVGVPPDMRGLRIDNITDGQVITVGSDQWKCFPLIRKNGPSGVENSANFGFAYRVVP